MYFILNKYHSNIYGHYFFQKTARGGLQNFIHSDLAYTFFGSVLLETTLDTPQPYKKVWGINL